MRIGPLIDIPCYTTPIMVIDRMPEHTPDFSIGVSAAGGRNVGGLLALSSARAQIAVGATSANHRDERSALGIGAPPTPA